MPKSVDRLPSLAHDDEGFLRPDAWAEAKQAFGSRGDVAQMLERLEQCSFANPRLLLAAAIHEFLRVGEDERRRAVEQYLRLPHATCSTTTNGDPERSETVPKRKPKSNSRTRRRP